MSLQEIAPLASPLPPLSDIEVFSPSQWSTLMALGETIIPSIDAASCSAPLKLAIRPTEYNSIADRLQSILPADADSSLVHAYLAESATSIPALKILLQRFLSDFAGPDIRRDVGVLLSALNTRAGCLLTTGSTTPFHLQPVHVRERILQNWTRSNLPPLRQSIKGLSFLFKSMWLKTSPTIGPVLGFPRVPVHGKLGKGFDYDFIQFPPGNTIETIETDVVVIGSGCGGGVCTKNLAEAGYRVLCVEKAYHFPAEHFPMSELEASIHLFQNGGVEVSDDSSISVLSGKAWGGGGLVNWSASLQTQAFVREEWAARGLPLFTSSDFQTCLDRVCQRMGVSADYIDHNKTNQVLMEGSRKLGYSVHAVPQNTGRNQHYCGYCTLGCASCEKQGPAVSFLPDAQKSGAKFIEGFEAEKIIFERRGGNKVAVGVQGTWRSRDSNGGVSGNDQTTRKLIIKAKRVILSCGTLQSPLLLIRSGLQNPHIGRNLYLHPANVFGAVFPEKVNPWEGGILSSACTSFENLDGYGHGTKLEATSMLPSFFLPLIPWTSGGDYKVLAANLHHMTGFISLVRDRDAGRVYPDPTTGKCRIAYTPSAFDRKHALEGLEALAKIAYVGGAKTLFTTTANVPYFERKEVPEGEPDPGINDPEFQAWLALIRKKGLSSPDASFASAHQMGSCRMGVSERCSVVDQDGRVWGTEGLFVADASVFPSASGVNPMVTNMAIADWISRGVVRGLGARREARL